jgi:chemotaxis protein methyltransferase CheR
MTATATSAQPTKMSDEQFAKLRQIIYQRSGIWFAEGKKYVLESRLAQRLRQLEMDDFDQYSMLLSIGPYREDEFNEMFSRITINETSFFRNAPQLEVFEQRVLPVLLEARNNVKRLRLWSAACSSGEEPYTLAIMLHRSLGVRLPDWHVEILGTDLSQKMLLAAETGEYGQYALSNTDPLIVGRYFTKGMGSYKINDEIKSMVRFERHNLKDTLAAKRHGVWDVIFCRNVMIYFDQEMRDGCLKLFHQQLAEDGTLFIGHSETIRLPELYKARVEPYAFAYGKAGKE